MADFKQVQPLANSVGEFIEYWGFKHIHGRIWTLVFLSDKPLATPRIVETLEVSKGLVSIAIRELVDFGLLVQGEKTAYGAQTYLPTEDITSVVRNILRRRELELIAKTQVHLEMLGSLSSEELKEASISPSRLSELHEFTQASRELLDGFVKKNTRTLQDWYGVVKTARKIQRSMSQKKKSLSPTPVHNSAAPSPSDSGSSLAL